MLAGFEDGLVDEGPAAAGPSLVGLEIARESDWTAPPLDEPEAPDEGRDRVAEAAAEEADTSRAETETKVDESPADVARRVTMTIDVDMLTPVLTKNWGDDRAWTLAAYEDQGGYEALTQGARDGARRPRRAGQGLRPARPRRRRLPHRHEVGLHPAGRPRRNKPKYLVVNADESEPGTCKDIPLMMASPHTLIEGVIIAAHAIRAKTAFIYVRGEVLHVVRRLQAAAREAYDAGHLGAGHPSAAGVDVDLVIHAGAGAYICGEETALLDSLEGRRGQPRLRPPFPAVEGLYACPTVINNVESIASVPSHRHRAASTGSASMGTEKSKGYTLYSLSGHVKTPGQYEAPLGITLRELLDLGGGMRDDGRAEVLDARRLVDADPHRRAPRRPARLRGRRRGRLDARHQGAAGLRPDHVGRALRAALDRVLQARVVRQVHAVPRGHVVAGPDPAAPRRRARASTGDIELLLDLCDNILGRSFCALGDGATSPITSAIQYFREEFEAGMHTPSSELFPPAASTLFAP